MRPTTVSRETVPRVAGSAPRSQVFRGRKRTGISVDRWAHSAWPAGTHRTARWKTIVDPTRRCSLGIVSLGHGPWSQSPVRLAHIPSPHEIHGVVLRDPLAAVQAFPARQVPAVPVGSAFRRRLPLGVREVIWGANRPAGAPPGAPPPTALAWSVRSRLSPTSMGRSAVETEAAAEAMTSGRSDAHSRAERRGGKG